MEKKNQPYCFKVGGIFVVLAIVAGLAGVFFLLLDIWLDKQFDSKPIITIVAITALFFSTRNQHPYSSQNFYYSISPARKK